VINRHSRHLLWAVLLVTLLQTSLVLQYSARQGRLALPVYFDDNHTLVDGARRLEVWYQWGTIALLQDYEVNPPHAPGHSALAMASFAIFGLHEWAPYLTNALFFGLLLTALTLALSGMKIWLQTSCIVLLASTPIAGLSILEFRSEVDVAALGVLGVLLFIRWSSRQLASQKTWSLLTLSALCFAACFFIKPAVFPYTLGLMSLCVLFHFRLMFSAHTQRISLWPIIWPMSFFFLLALLLPLPHYLLDWHHITGYIGAIAFSPASVWLRHDDWISSLLFNLTGYPGKIMLGSFLNPSIALITAALITPIVTRTSWPATLPLRPLLFFTLGAYAGVAVNPMNQNYFGMTFQWLLLITALVALCGLMILVFPNHQRHVTILLSGVALVLFLGCKFPLSIDFYREKANGDPATFLWLQQTPELVMEPIRREQQKSGGTKVWITAYTMINARTLEWYSLLHHDPFLYKDFIESDWKVVPSSLDWADYVIVPEKGTPSLETMIPNAAMAEKMVDQLDHDTRFQLLERLSSPQNGSGFRIYAKKPRVTLSS
jgi:hypothetical protein